MTTPILLSQLGKFLRYSTILQIQTFIETKVSAMKLQSFNRNLDNKI